MDWVVVAVIVSESWGMEWVLSLA